MSERSTTSAEVRFTRKLASNDERTRRRALKALQTWLEARSQRKDGGEAVGKITRALCCLVPRPSMEASHRSDGM